MCSYPISSDRCCSRYSRVNASLPRTSSGRRVKSGASGVQFGLSSHRCGMAMTQYPGSLDADRLIMTHLWMWSVFEPGTMSSHWSPLNCIDPWVRSHCANSLWPWIRSFTVHFSLPTWRNPECGMRNAPRMPPSQWSCASCSGRILIRRPCIIAWRTFLFSLPWNQFIPLMMRCRRWLPNGLVLSMRSMWSDCWPVR